MQKRQQKRKSKFMRNFRSCGNKRSSVTSLLHSTTRTLLDAIIDHCNLTYNGRLLFDSTAMLTILFTMPPEKDIGNHMSAAWSALVGIPTDKENVAFPCLLDLDQLANATFKICNGKSHKCSIKYQVEHFSSWQEEPVRPMDCWMLQSRRPFPCPE